MFIYLFLISISGQDNFCLVHVSLIPVLGVVGEQVILHNLYMRFAKFYLSTYWIVNVEITVDYIP